MILTVMALEVVGDDERQPQQGDEMGPTSLTGAPFLLSPLSAPPVKQT